MAVSTDALDLHRLAQLLPAIRNLVGDDSVTEIMITCHPTRGVLVFFEKKGLLYRAPLKDVARRDVEGFCHSVSRPLGSNLQDKPLVDARLADGSRVAIAVPPASPRGPAVTIRRFSKVRYSGADLVGFGSLPMAVFELLVDAVKKGGNILVAGGTGSGKTTLLNALIAEFAPDDRLVVIEDVIELKIDHPNIVRLEARGLEGKNMTARDMVRHALRQRPDHIVLGEVRGGRGLRRPPGSQHRPRRIDDDHPCEHGPGRASPDGVLRPRGGGVDAVAGDCDVGRHGVRHRGVPAPPPRPVPGVSLIFSGSPVTTGTPVSGRSRSFGRRRRTSLGLWSRSRFRPRSRPRGSSISRRPSMLRRPSIPRRMSTSTSTSTMWRLSAGRLPSVPARASVLPRSSTVGRLPASCLIRETPRSPKRLWPSRPPPA